MNAILRQHKNSKKCCGVIACFGPSHQDSILSKTTRLGVIPGTSTPFLEGTDQTCTKKMLCVCFLPGFVQMTIMI